MLKDIVIRGEHRLESVAFRGNCYQLAGRTALTAKGDCEDPASYLPVYHCVQFRLCSPFGKVVDAGLIQACETCPVYAHTLAENTQTDHHT